MGATLTNEEIERYQQGKGKGEEKWIYDIKRLTPLSQLDQLEELDISTRLITKGGSR